MSNSQYFLDGRKCGKLPEKSNFAQTCNLLSQYMKEKGNLRDLSLGMNGKFEALGKSETSRVTTPPPTMNLLNNMENSRTEKSVDLFPHYAPAGEDTTNEANSSKAATMEAKAGQMTIFYRGQVLVFDDFPAEKVTEITLLANRGISQHTSFADRKVDNMAAGSSTPSSSSSNPGSDRQAAIGGSDMPIARRASLHRFLEKRKDRSTVRAAPYQLHNPPQSAASPKRGDQEEQFDLNL